MAGKIVFLLHIYHNFTWIINYLVHLQNVENKIEYTSCMEHNLFYSL